MIQKESFFVAYCLLAWTAVRLYGCIKTCARIPSALPRSLRPNRIRSRNIHVADRPRRFAALSRHVCVVRREETRTPWELSATFFRERRNNMYCRRGLNVSRFFFFLRRMLSRGKIYYRAFFLLRYIFSFAALRVRGAAVYNKRLN